MGSVTAAADHPLPVNIRSSRPNWLVFGAFAIVLIAGPGVIAGALALLQTR